MSGLVSNLPPFGPARDAFILAAISAGALDVPTWVRVPMGRVEVAVSSDYLTICDERVPMASYVAQAAVDSLDAILPTPAVVMAIEEAARAVGGLIPFDPWPRSSDGSQLDAPTIAWREGNIERRLGGARPAIVAGHLKDVVIAPSMPAGKVVIYGALSPSGARVQHVCADHGDYFDGGYAHGVRAVRRRCWLDGGETTVDEVLGGPHAALLGGPVAALRYPARAS